MKQFQRQEHIFCQQKSLENKEGFKLKPSDMSLCCLHRPQKPFRQQGQQAERMLETRMANHHHLMNRTNLQEPAYLHNREKKVPELHFRVLSPAMPPRS